MTFADAVVCSMATDEPSRRAPCTRRQQELTDMAAAGDAWAKSRLRENARERGKRQRANNGDEAALRWRTKKNQRRQDARAAAKAKRDSGDLEAMAKEQRRLGRKNAWKRDRRAQMHAGITTSGQSSTLGEGDGRGELGSTTIEPGYDESDDSEDDKPLKLRRSTRNARRNTPGARDATTCELKHEDADDDTDTVTVAARAPQAAEVSMPAAAPAIKAEDAQAEPDIVDLTEDDVKPPLASIDGLPQTTSRRAVPETKSTHEQELQLQLRKIQLQRREARLEADEMEVEVELMRLRRRV